MNAPSAANGPEPLTFNYASLDPDVAAGAREAADRIRSRMHNNILETGRDLIAVKERLEHGEFAAWIKAELDISMRTAQNFMNGSRLLVGKNATVAFLPPTVIYALAGPSAPVAVVNKILEAVEAGAPITTAQSKRRRWLLPSRLNATLRSKRRGMRRSRH